MFSYRHAFHAGNHADVLKHTVLIAAIAHLTQKEAALTVLDTHAGTGLYQLNDHFSHTSGEAAQGVEKLWAESTENLCPALADYVELIQQFNPTGQRHVYPGSPMIMHSLLRPHDRLKLFELHPTDAKALTQNVEHLRAGRQVTVHIEDGFDGPKKFLPPPSRRAFVLCDPSYELKTDYARVADMLTDALKRFATGTYAVWYPLIARRESQELPERLHAIASKAGKSWLNATLTVKDTSPALYQANAQQRDGASDGVARPGLAASGMFLINPPYTLRNSLQEALVQMTRLLGQDKRAHFTLNYGE